jgi:hypothetical protein
VGDEHGMRKNETAIENRKFERVAKPGTTKSTQRKATDLAEIRWQITDLAGNGAVGMVETTMEEVGKGHYLGMKYLFEIDLGDDGPVEDSLAATLLRRLGIPDRRRRTQELPKIPHDWGVGVRGCFRMKASSWATATSRW